MTTYNCWLINKDGCTFDGCVGYNKKKIVEWGKGRGGEYIIHIRKKVSDNRFFGGEYEHITIPVKNDRCMWVLACKWVSDFTGNAY